MANMIYCRWRNTLNDLRDCAQTLDYDLSDDEAAARTKLLELCRNMVAEAVDLGLIEEE